jgi:arginase
LDICDRVVEMRVQIIEVPYDSGHRNLRMGAGPEHFVRNGVEGALRDCGHEVQVDCIEAQAPFRAEIKTAFELYRTLAARVASACGEGRFPLVLSGNCSSSLGTLAGLGADRLGIIWFDGHGDFNTPETTESGFLDGMGLATAAGLCWRKMAASIPNFRPIPGNNILHVGGRDFYPEERANFEQSGGTIISAEAIRDADVREALGPSLEALKRRVSRIYLHFDLDVLDPARCPANEFAAPDGLTLAQIEEAIRLIGERLTICAGAIASYDPLLDVKDEVLGAGLAIMKGILSAADNHPARQRH